MITTSVKKVKRWRARSNQDILDKFGESGIYDSMDREERRQLNEEDLEDLDIETPIYT
jgi:hypothetical protein